MTSFERDRRPPARIGIAATLGIVALLTTAAAALGADPSTGTGTGSASSIIEMVASGSFGRVAGLAQDATPDPTSLTVLDAWARGTTLDLAPADGTIVEESGLTSFAEPGLEVAGSLKPIGGLGSHSFQLLDTGLFLVRFGATVQPDTGGPSSGSWWWRIAVPDRDLPVGEGTAPPPAIRIASGDRSRTLEQGSGCYVGTCGDIGGVPPSGQLPTIRTLAGAPLTMSLSDGSDMTGWRIDATPVDGTDADTIVLGEASGAAPTSRVVVPAPAEGSWVVLVHVTFDHERGSFDGYGRLVLRPRDIR